MAWNYPYLVASTQTITSSLATHNGFASSSNVGWTVNAGFRQLLATCPMAFTRMYTQLTTAPGAGTSKTFQSRKNLSVDNLSLTISDANTLGSDTTHTTNLIAGDLIDIYNTWTGSPADSITANQWSVYAASANQVLSSATGAVIATGTTRYTGIQSTSGTSATRTDVEQVFPTSGTIKNLYAYIGSGALASGNYVVTIYQNGNPTSITCTVDSSNRLNSDTSHSISVAPGDLLAVEIAANSPSSNRTVLVSCEFQPSSPGEGVLLATTGATTVTHTTKQYSCFYTCSNVFGTATAGKQSYGLPMTITKIYAVTGTDPGSGKTRTLAVDNNGSDVISVALDSSHLSNSATGSAQIKLGDPICISSVATGSTTAGTLKIGVAFQAPNLSAAFLNN